MNSETPSRPIIRKDVLLALLVVFCLGMIGYSSYLISGRSSPDSTDHTITHTYTGYDVETLAHDGHLLIVHENGGMMHHPDCPCRRDER